jgi:hypothetical protein
MDPKLERYYQYIMDDLLKNTIIDQYVEDGSETYSTRGSFDGNIDGAYIKMPYNTPLDWYRLDSGIPQPLYHSNVVDKGFSELMTEKYGAREEDIWNVWDIYRGKLMTMFGYDKE